MPPRCAAVTFSLRCTCGGAGHGKGPAALATTPSCPEARRVHVEATMLRRPYEVYIYTYKERERGLGAYRGSVHIHAMDHVAALALTLRQPCYGPCCGACTDTAAAQARALFSIRRPAGEHHVIITVADAALAGRCVNTHKHTNARARAHTHTHTTHVALAGRFSSLGVVTGPARASGAASTVSRFRHSRPRPAGTWGRSGCAGGPAQGRMVRRRRGVRVA
jgi:hypothetical protein